MLADTGSRHEPHAPASGEHASSVEAPQFPTEEPGGGGGCVAHGVKLRLTHGAVPVVADGGLLVSRNMYGAQRRGKEAAGRIVQGLPAAGELDGTPGGRRPAIVELPVERAHAAGHQTTVVLDADLHAVGLVELGKVDQAGLRSRPPVAAGNVVQDDLIAGAVLLMVFHRGAEYIAVVRRAAGGVGGGRAVALHPEFAHEPKRPLFIILDGMAGVPDVPVMRVAGSFAGVVACGFDRAAPGRAGPVGGHRIMPGQRRRDRAVEELFVAPAQRCLPQSGIEHGQLVVAAPKGQAGAMPKSFDLKRDFGPDTGEKVPVGGIERARKHEVLPYQQAQFVTEIVERLAFVDAAAPHADGVHMDRGGGPEIAIVATASQAGDETVRRYPVGAFEKDRTPVDDEAERFPPSIGRAVQAKGAQSDPPFQGAERPARAVANRDGEMVKRLCALSGGPPQLRGGHGEFARGGGGEIDAGDRAARQRKRGGDDGRPVGAGELRGHGEGNRAAGCVMLTDFEIDQPVAGPRFQTKIPPDAGGDEARAPVPTELTLLFANAHAPADGIVEFPGRRKILAGRPDVIQRAAKADAENVAARPDEFLHGPAMADKHVVGLSDHAIIERDRGHGIEAVGHELDDVLPRQGGGNGEGRPILPIAGFDPLEGQFVGAEKRIGNPPCRPQVGMDTAGHGGG